ncbi:MAG: hypothetical protein WBB23_25430 [Desulforhopalus sp.]
MDDLTKALTYEIKQDIAHRYFGFRKRIETESNQYLEKLQNVDQDYINGIQTDVQRMQCLLRKEALFLSFMKYTELPAAIINFADPQAFIKCRLLFENLKGEGLTRKRRYRNLVYQTYNSLACNVAGYQHIFVKLEEEHEEICKEIDIFYRKNDLSGILNFLRALDNPDESRSGILYADGAGLASGNLDREMRITPPPPVSTRMHSLKQLLPLKEAKPMLNDLIKQAYPLFDRVDLQKLPI